MSYYRVEISVKNFLIQFEGKETLMGFYTSHFVETNDG